MMVISHQPAMSWKPHTTMCNVLEAAHHNGNVLEDAHHNVLEAAHVQDASRLGGPEFQWRGREAKTKIDCGGDGCSFDINWKERSTCSGIVGGSGRNSFLHDWFCCSVKSFTIKKSFVKILFFVANMVLDAVKVFFLREK